MLPEIELSRLRIEGVTAEFTEDPYSPAPKLRVALRIYDVKTGKRETVQSHRVLSTNASELMKGYAFHVRSALAEMIAHELTECMTLDGKRVEDPHPEGGWGINVDGTARTRTRSDWEEPPAKCDCPKGKQAAINWARANANESTLEVCQLAFQRINDSLGKSVVELGGWQRGRLEIPILSRPLRTFACDPGPDSMLRILYVTDTKDHE